MEPPSAYDLSRQARWETEGFTRAIRRYREAASHQDLSALPPGVALLKRVVPLLTDAIRRAQNTAADALTQPGRQPEWSWPIQLPDPERLAVITLTTCLGGVVRRGEGDGLGSNPGAVVSLSRTIASAARMQIEYDRWAGESPDVEERLRKRYPAMSRRIWTRWRKKVEVTRCEPWSVGQQTALGAHLVFLLAQSAPDWFALETRGVAGGRTQRCLVPTVRTLDLMRDTEARAEVARPLLMPTLIPPLPWIYSEPRDVGLHH